MMGLWESKKDALICYFDIDGVLNYYPDTWLEFLNCNKHKTGLHNVIDLQFAKANIPYADYRALKKEYRESGVKETLDVRRGAFEVIHHLKHARGYKIIIITSRPVRKHPTLFKQTINWLENNNIPYDDVIFAEDKHVEVLTRYPHLKFGVEDHRYYANLVGSWGYKMFLLKNQYNIGELHENVTPIASLDEILGLI